MNLEISRQLFHIYLSYSCLPFILISTLVVRVLIIIHNDFNFITLHCQECR